MNFFSTLIFINFRIFLNSKKFRKILKNLSKNCWKIEKITKNKKTGAYFLNFYSNPFVRLGLGRWFDFGIGNKTPYKATLRFGPWTFVEPKGNLPPAAGPDPRVDRWGWNGQKRMSIPNAIQSLGLHRNKKEDQVGLFFAWRNSRSLIFGRDSFRGYDP